MNCLGKDYPADFPVDGLPAAVYPLDGHANPGYTYINETRSALTIDVHDKAGEVKQGVRADGSSAPLEVRLLAN
jgi:hypothetical protein